VLPLNHLHTNISNKRSELKLVMSCFRFTLWLRSQLNDF